MNNNRFISNSLIGSSYIAVHSTQNLKLLKNVSILFSGWERHYSGLSDSDLATHSTNSHRMPHRIRHSLSPDKELLADLGDSDMESVVSVTSSAFSTQSERPRCSRNLTYVYLLQNCYEG